MLSEKEKIIFMNTKYERSTNILLKNLDGKICFSYAKK
jgi:hypothetical protein